MEDLYLESFCHSLAKAFSTGVRMYHEKKLLYYYSVGHLHPDPVSPYLDVILQSRHSSGIFTTPLYQFYGFFTPKEEIRIILGPTRILQDRAREMEELLFLLGITQEQKKEYLYALRSAPLIHADRFAWLLSAVMSSLLGRDYPVEEVWMQIRPENYFEKISSEALEKRPEIHEDMNEKQVVQQSYAWEQLVCSYIEDGQPETLRDLFLAPPRIESGQMAQDSLRQIKNAGICTATVAARTAIRGGMDSAAAFRMSDLYIQKLELLRSALSVEKLIQEMIINFAEQVRQMKSCSLNGSKLTSHCIKYVAQNIYAPIRAEEIAHEFGYTRSYLCSQFKKQTGSSLTQYILKEKVQEAKRILQFTDKSLCEIAGLFAFSSQSHFQTVFKKVTGETPMSYRERVKEQ